jgi:diguanylate cyclase (GGDEF)-like protein
MEWHYETEIIAAVILIIILCDAQREFSKSSRRNTIFLLSVVFAIVSSLVDIADSAISMAGAPIGLQFAFRTMYFIFSTVPALMWFFYLCSITYEKEDRRFWSWTIFGIISFIAYVIMLMVNIGVKNLFYYDEGGVYRHGAYYNLTYAFCLFYTVMFIALLLTNIKKINNTKLVLYLLLLPAIIWIGLVLELTISGWVMLGASYAIALLTSYLLIQNQHTSQVIGELSHQANTDNLTGLANRAAFENEAKRCFSSSNVKTCALLLVDIDGLKTINDSLGHPMGDKAICTVGSILKSGLKDATVVARIGGDEFALIIINKDGDSIEAELKEMMKQFDSLAISSQGHDSIPLSCSVGAAFKEADDSNFADLYYHADVALYSVKRKGKYSYAFYQASMEEDYKSPQ